MEDGYALETALLEHLDQLLDTPWNDGCLPTPEVMCNQHHQQRVAPLAPLPRSMSSSVRQLAPAPMPSGPLGMQARCQPRPTPPSVPTPLREQDRLLPMANVARLMTSELKKDSKVAKDAKLLMQEFVSEFICFVTSEAADFAAAADHKAIMPDDFLNALESLGKHTSRRRPYVAREILY